MLSLLLLNLQSAAATSAVAFLAILVRSGDVVSASMKALAEFSTILGMYAGLAWLKNSSRAAKPASFLLGCVVRVLVMAVANLIVLPLYASVPFDFAVMMTPLTAAFNTIQGLVNMFGGYLVYEALVRRIPSMAPAAAETS